MAASDSPDEAEFHQAVLTEADALLPEEECIEGCPAYVLGWVRVAAHVWVATEEMCDVLGVGPLSAAF